MFEVTEQASERIKAFLKANGKSYVVTLLFRSC
jgi:hypothetical protein